MNQAANKTITTTRYAGKVTYTIDFKVHTAEASDVMTDTRFVFSRSDVNENGTVTHKDMSGAVMYVFNTTFEFSSSY